MPKKSRKSRAKYKVRRSPKLTPLREVSQQAQALPLQSKEATATKSPVTIGGYADRYRQIIAELKRIGLIAVILLVLLIIISLLLR